MTSFKDSVAAAAQPALFGNVLKWADFVCDAAHPMGEEGRRARASGEHAEMDREGVMEYDLGILLLG